MGPPEVVADRPLGAAAANSLARVAVLPSSATCSNPGEAGLPGSNRSNDPSLRPRKTGVSAVPPEGSRFSTVTVTVCPAAEPASMSAAIAVRVISLSIQKIPHRAG